MINTIKDLYENQKSIWKEENEKYFGITPLMSWDDPSLVSAHLNECTDKFWNGGTNELKRLFENGKCRDIDKLVPGSYEFVFDALNGFVCLYAKFEYEVDDIISGEIRKEIKRAPLSYLPYPNDICWFLNNSEYVLRITANINYSIITRIGNICQYQKTWTYDIDKDEFTINIENFDPYENLTNINRTFLENCFEDEITADNFKESLASIPEFDKNSILYFKFGYIDDIFKLVSLSNRFANPLMKVSIPINIVKMFTAQKNRDDNRDSGSFSNLVLSSNKLFALENSRTVIYKSVFNSSFSFTDSNKVFDAFKTSTNKSAGRSRLILDTVTVKDGMLHNKFNGKTFNMYELITNDKIEIKNNLSVLSCSKFSSSNDAKRLMMTAKLRAQAIPTLGEIDEFTHETPARIVFGDFEGFNFGDSIIVSRSFARKMKTFYEKKIKFNKIQDYNKVKSKYKVGDVMSIKDFYDVTKTTMYNNYRNITIRAIDENYLSIIAEAPLCVGDKITNLHGSKGIVSLILEDEDMPYLKNDIGDFKAGPFEVITSALSVFRRKTSGQLFEAWSLASGHDDVNNIQDVATNYLEEVKTFSEKSIICWNGEETIKPCGINIMIRLDHDAVTKQSHSYIKSNYARMLKFGEMELLNLASRGFYDILNEIDIRSVSKHYNSYEEIKKMQETGYCNNETANNLRFFNILKDIGFNFNLRQIIEDEDIDSNFEKLRELLTDTQIELF